MGLGQDEAARLVAYHATQVRKRRRTCAVQVTTPALCVLGVLVFRGSWLGMVFAAATWGTSAWNVQTARLAGLRRRAWDLVYDGPPGMENIVKGFAMVQDAVDDPILHWVTDYARKLDAEAAIELRRQRAETS